MYSRRLWSWVYSTCASLGAGLTATFLSHTSLKQRKKLFHLLTRATKKIVCQERIFHGRTMSKVVPANVKIEGKFSRGLRRKRIAGKGATKTSHHWTRGWRAANGRLDQAWRVDVPFAWITTIVSPAHHGIAPCSAPCSALPCLTLPLHRDQARQTQRPLGQMNRPMLSLVQYPRFAT